MFKNVGKKIKILAWIIFIIGFIAGVAVGILSAARLYYYTPNMTRITAVLIGIAYALFYMIISYLSTLALYGFGTLVDNSQALRENSENKTEESISTEMQ